MKSLDGKKKSTIKSADRPIDDVDKAIMVELQKNPQTSNKRLAQLFSVSEMTIASRIERLISDKLMKITIQRDIRTLGFNIVGMVDVYVTGADVLAVGRRIGAGLNIFSVTIHADHPQICALLMAQDMKQFHKLLESEIVTVHGVTKTVTSMCLEVLEFRSGIAVL